jgi:hypothetical protein
VRQSVARIRFYCFLILWFHSTFSLLACMTASCKFPKKRCHVNYCKTLGTTCQVKVRNKSRFPKFAIGGEVGYVITNSK